MHFDDIQVIADGVTDSYTYTYNSANELTAMSGPNGSTSYGYDEYGRMTSKSRGTASATYGYRYGHKLYSVYSTFPEEAAALYETGGDGKRRQRVAQGTDTWYRWDAGYTVLNEEDGPSAGFPNGNFQRGYVERNMARRGQNPKFEYRNPKQIRMTEYQNS